MPGDRARQRVGGGADGKVAHGGHELHRRRLAVAVVLGDEDRGELPDRGQVERLVELALVGGAVAEERDRHAARPLHLRGERRANREGDAGADDPVRAEHAPVEVGDVHGSALAAAQPGLLGE